MSYRVNRPGRLALFAVLLLALGQNAWAGPLFESIKARGHLLCGTRNDVHGFAYLDDQGRNTGFEIALCQAVAAAVFGDKSKVQYIMVGAADRLVAVRQGTVDVLFSTTTWTYSRDVDGLDFPAISFFDSQGFLATRALGIRSILAAPAGTKVCVARATTTATNLAEYAAKHQIELQTVEFTTPLEARQAFYGGDCDVYTNDRSLLAISHATEAPQRNDYVLLPDAISKEPLGPVVLQGDPQWTDIVRWVMYATIEAEERNMSSSNVAVQANSADPVVRFLLGASPGLGKYLGLDDQWLLRVVSQVGNYGEIYDRYLGANSSLNMTRGINDLWSRGGLLYAPPLR